MNPNKALRFIYPEASFLANIRIAETILGADSCIKLAKPSKNNFFFSTEQVDELYADPSDGLSQSIYYITPVGNPTGEKMDSSELYSLLTHIHTHDRAAICILDTVYVGLLRQTASSEMFANIFQNSALTDQLIFSESLSKTLGTTGIRIGWIWTTNQTLLQGLKKTIILKKAGFSKILDNFTVSLLSNLPQKIDFQEKVYTF